jgi:glycosyltransferase involved in cell wall biosynthesis
MRILFITTRLPHARVASGHVIVYQRIKRLAERGHEIGLIVFDDPGRPGHIDELRALTKEIEVVPPPNPHSYARGAVDLAFSSIPPYFQNYRSEEMMRRIGEMVDRSHYHVAIAEFSAMGQYLFRNRYLSAVRKIISCHYSIATSYRKVADLMRYSARGLRSRVSLGGLLRYEVDMYRNVDHVLVLTAQERFVLQRYDPHLRVNVIPCGVDTKYFKPPKEETEECILFTGHYESEPNRDAVLWFAHRVWPIVKQRRPAVKFYVVGPGVSQEISDLMKRDKSIVVTGEVEDVRPYMQKARVFLCPVRLGSGLRVKILEAMAAGVPVVSTSLGAEGIPLHTGDNALLADTPEMMAENIVLLLEDETLRTSIIRQARTLMEDRFAWDRGIDMLEDVLASAVVGR